MTQPRPSVSIILVTHNSAASLPAFLKSLLNIPDQTSWELLVVDNASTDGSADLVRRTCPNASVFVNDTNRGFAAAVNQGAGWSSGEFLLPANPDTSWNQPVIAPLLEFLQTNPKAAAVCPKLTYPDGAPQLSIRRFPTHANIWFSRGSPLKTSGSKRKLPWSYTMQYPKEPAKVEAVAATFLLIRRAAFDEVGGVDEGYFLYVEDTDLCKRWHDKGWEVWVDPRLTVTHDWQAGSRRDPKLARIHREGIRRYFRTHYRRKRIRNAILSTILEFADVLSRIRTIGKRLR